MTKPLILLVEDETFIMAKRLADKAGLRCIVAQSAEGGYKCMYPNANFMKESHDYQSLLCLLDGTNQISYDPGAEEILRENSEIRGVLLDRCYPRRLNGKPIETMWKEFAEKCLDKGIPCVICTGTRWPEEEDDEQSKHYKFPIVGRKDWDKAIRKLKELIEAKQKEAV